MKTKCLTILFAVLFLVQFKVSAQAVFELDRNQSMLMFGKGPGQDATINPYEGEDCFAVIKNLGTTEFSIRIQQKGKIIKILPVKKKEVKKVKLLVGYELYLDSESVEKANASVAYEKINPQ